MYTQEHEEPKLIISRGPTSGELWLKGYADGHNGRPRVKQRTKRSREAYAKGYDAALAMKQPGQPGSAVIGFQVPGSANKPKPGKRAGSIRLSS
jgi:hypothetical protein